MEKNQTVQLTIDNLGMNGEGVARVNGEVVFVPFALKGETITCKCINTKNKFAIMKIENLLTTSPFRTVPLCPYFKKCGGCDLQHLLYEKQLEFKTNLVKETLKKVGNIEASVDDCEPSIDEYNYRNKASFPIVFDNGYKIGMYRVASHSLVEIDYCYLQKNSINKLLKLVIKWLDKINCTYYASQYEIDKNSQNKTTLGNNRNIEHKRQKQTILDDNRQGQNILEGNIQNEINSQQTKIDLKSQKVQIIDKNGLNDTYSQINTLKKTNNDKTSQNVSRLNRQLMQNYDKLRYLVAREIDNKILITLVATGTNIPLINELIISLKDNFDNFGLNVNINKQDNNVILSNNYKHIYGSEFLEINADGVKQSITNASFYQVNDYIKNKIYKQVKDYLDSNIVIDAFSGAGLLTSMISQKAKKVYGIEIVKSASESANKLMQENNIQNVENICGDCTVKLPELIKKLGGDVSVVLDPPRKGCDKKVLKAIIDSKAKKVIYIACSPISLSRDAKILVEEGGYKVKSVKPFDMFPQTKNVETLMVLEK